MNKAYRSKLEVSPLYDGKTWEVTSPFEFIAYGQKFVIPVGFTFDFASIPVAFRWLFQPATGKYRMAALCHDYLYTTKTFSRLYADNFFLDMMKQDGVNWIKRYTIYWAVRLGGGSYYG